MDVDGAHERTAHVLARGVLRRHVLEAHRVAAGHEARAVAGRDVSLLEHEVGDVLLLGLVVEGDDGVVRHAREDELAVGVRRARGDGVAELVVLLVGLIEVELGALDGVAVLVNLVHLGDGLGHEVEPEMHVRGVRATLEVEELERVLGVGLERVAVKVVRGLARSREQALERAFARAVHAHIARVEVDVERGGVVDAAEVSHEHVVDVDPDVVVSGELELHVARLAVVGRDARRAVLGRLDELRGHGQAKVVVEQGVAVSIRLRVGAHLACRVEREEHARLLELHGRLAVDLEGVRGRVVGGEVPLAVVLVVAVDRLEKPTHAQVGLLAGPDARVKEVGKGLGVIVGVAMVAGGNLGIAVDEGVGDVAHAGGAARPLVDAASVAAVELELVARVDARDAVDVVRLVVRDPVVEQVDRRARRRDRRDGGLGNGKRRGRRADKSDDGDECSRRQGDAKVANAAKGLAHTLRTSRDMPAQHGNSPHFK